MIRLAIEMKNLVWIISLLLLGGPFLLAADEAHESNRFSLDLRLSLAEWIERQDEANGGFYELVGPLQISNLLAYALGVDPSLVTQENLPQMTRDPMEPDVLKLTYQKSRDTLGVEFVIEESGDLVAWTPAEPLNDERLGEIAPGVESREATFLIGENSNMYYRVRVQPE